MRLSTSSAIARKRNSRGITLVETMIVFALVGLIFAMIMQTYKYAGTSFVAMGNYSDLDRKSREALDIMSREIRNSSSLLAVTNSTTKSMTFNNASTGKQVTILYDSTARTVTLYKTGQSAQTLLTSCDQWDYALYGRTPNFTNSNIIFYGATNGSGSVDVTACKLVNMTWKCSRNIFGSKRDTESIQTAEIVLRNKVY